MKILFYVLTLYLIIIYSCCLFVFLNALFRNNLLFESSGETDVAIFFSQDIFDLFWLLIMWLPLTHFSASFLWRSLSISAIKPLLLFLPIIFSIGFILGFRVVAKSTDSFNTQREKPIVWSKMLKQRNLHIYRVYNGMELYNCVLLILDASLTFIYLYCAIFKKTTNSTLCTFALVSGLIFLAYFVMNALSKLVVHIKLKLKNDKDLFPIWQIAIGTLIIFVLSLTIIEYLTEMDRSCDMHKTLSFIFASILLPCIPIAIQIIQLASPLKNISN